MFPNVALILLLFGLGFGDSHSLAASPSVLWLQKQSKIAREAEALIQTSIEQLNGDLSHDRSLVARIERELLDRSTYKESDGSTQRADIYVGYRVIFEPIWKLDLSPSHRAEFCLEAEHEIRLGQSGALTQSQSGEASYSPEADFALRLIRGFCQKS